MLATLAGVFRSTSCRITSAALPTRAVSSQMTDVTEQAGFYEELQTSSGVYKYYVNGVWKESVSGKTVGINNPSTEEKVFQVQGGGWDGMGWDAQRMMGFGYCD